MKNLSKNLLMIVMVMTSFLSFSNEVNTENTLTILNDSKLKVVFKDVKKGQVLSVTSEDGTKLYSEEISLDGNLTKVLDLSFLDNGKYKIELEKDFQIIVNHIVVKDNKVSFDRKKEKVVFKPVVRNEDNLLMVSKIAFDKEPLQIAIYYENNVIYSETVKSDAIINRAYKLQEEIEGPYKVVLYNNNRSYTHNFKI